MRKLSVLSVLAVVVLSLVATMAVAGPSQPPDQSVIDEAQAKRAPVAFPHKKHTEVVDSCVTCHHTQEGLTAANAAQTEVKNCATCHVNPTDPKAGSMAEMSLTKNPMHKGCIDCHKEQAKGPTKCDECHPKT
jgi:hypothetical protein